MEPRPGRRAFERQAERRTDTAAQHVLMGLFALTTTACDPFGYEELGRRKGIYEGKYEAEQAAEKAAAEKSPAALEAKARAQFKDKLVELERAGYSVEISGVTLSVDTTTSLSAGQLEELSSVSQDLEQAGLKMITTQADPPTALQEQLKNADRSLKVPIYQVSLVPTKDGIVVTVHNWLTDQQVITSTLKTFNNLDFDFNNPDSAYQQWRSANDASIEKIKAAINQDKIKLADTYGKLLTDHGISLNAMDIVRTRPGHGMEQIAQLFDTNDVYSITFNGFKHDLRTTSSPFIEWSFNEDDRGELLPTGSPELGGTLTSIEIRRIFVDSDQPGQQPTWWKTSSNSSLFQDRYGNTVIVTQSQTEYPENYGMDPYVSYVQDIIISVPTVFLDANGTEQDWQSWQGDLTTLDLPEFSDLVYSHPERPVTTKAFGDMQYSFYFEGDDSLSKDVWQGYYDMAVQGAYNVQTAFYGYQPEQQLVKNILIVPDPDKNGSFEPRNSATIALTSEHMDLMSSTDVYQVISTARHESSHAIFNHLQLGRDPELSSLHKRLSAEFFKVIAESNWQDKGFGGHAQDNTTEFFASFVNSLMVDDLETRMQAKLTPTTAAEYADAAKTVRLALEKPLRQQNGPYEPIDILAKLEEAERIAQAIAAPPK